MCLKKEFKIYLENYKILYCKSKIESSEKDQQVEVECLFIINQILIQRVLMPIDLINKT